MRRGERHALDPARCRADVRSMQWIVSVLSELAWGVTVGGLSAAAAAVGQAALIGCGVAGCGYMLWRRRRK